MPTIERLALRRLPDPSARWAEIVATVQAWARSARLGMSDAVVLLPFAQLLPLARHEFAKAGGWMPRIATTRTLAQALGPATPAEAGQLSFDATVDALAAARWLRSLPWGAALARRDPRGFERAVTDVVATAQQLAVAASALAPDDRADYWAGARATLAHAPGPGSSERMLARVALEWASLTPAPATDRLFDLRPAAWIVVQAGGPDALTAGLLGRAASHTPCVVIDTDLADLCDAPPFDRDGHAPAPAPATTPALAVCDSFEEEAQCAAAQVISHLKQGVQPVALIAQDRLLVRRIRALLERHRVVLLDETGWKLSTTRAAGQVVGLLRSAKADAPTDDLLDWLKSIPAWPGLDDTPGAIATLENSCRRGRIWRVAAIERAGLEGPAARLWSAASLVLHSVARGPRQPLEAWLATLGAALAACGSLAALRADDAGRQVLAALRLEGPAAPGSAWQLNAAGVSFDFEQFGAWVDGVLERESFLPAMPDGAPAQVVITPLAHAMLRPFAATIFPGADDKHLGATASPHRLLNDAQAAELGVPTAAQRRGAEFLAFAQALAAPHVTLLRRRLDAADPLADSPLVERLALALTQAGRGLARWQDRRSELLRPATPIRCSAPSAAGLLPRRLSASGLEALRACPYRFFALNMLRLSEDDELDGEIEKRDFGNWLHAVLQRFHCSRGAPQSGAAEVARLHQVAALIQAEQGLAAADFLPFSASFASFAPRYIAWLHRRDEAGATWQQAEHSVTTQPDGLGGIELHGIIDRIDAVDGPLGRALELIDYKTGSVQSLKDKVREPLEDTQLAFYAALMRSQTEAPLRAIYLALDQTQGIEAVEHPAVAQSAQALLHGVAHDWARLGSGAGMPALGQGRACDYCAARGICRRDHWTVDGGIGA